VFAVHLKLLALLAQCSRGSFIMYYFIKINTPKRILPSAYSLALLFRESFLVQGKDI
jgi:hypothetical protein